MSSEVIVFDLAIFVFEAANFALSSLSDKELLPVLVDKVSEFSDFRILSLDESLSTFELYTDTEFASSSEAAYESVVFTSLA